MNNLKITAIICTLNRKDYLTKAIQSLLEQTLNREEYEILIVDNRSTDETKYIVKNFQKNFPLVKYHYEEIPGLSQARNTGWKEARGKIVAYLDDDATATTVWLESILNVFESTSKETACVGGKISPLFEAPRPPWLPEELLYYLGNLDYSTELRAINGPVWLGGGNSAYSKDVLKKIGGFNTSVGRKGTNLLSMEDTLIQKRLIKEGYKIYYHPQVAILHSAPATRLTQDWFKRRAFWDGVSAAYAFELNNLLDRLKFIKSGLLSLASILLKPIRLFAMASSSDNPERFLQKCIGFEKLGYQYGIVKRAFGRYGRDL